MKQTFTCSLEEGTVFRIRNAARKGPYRNKSHLVEEAVLRLLGDFKAGDTQWD